MSALLTRWRRNALVGLLAGGVAAGTALAAVPAEAATVKNLVGNGSAETVTRQLPKGWTKGGSGTNTRALTSVTGSAANGKKFVRTTITRYRSGSAWWLTPAAAVRGGSTYAFTESYRSGRPTVVNAYFTVGSKVVGTKVVALPASAAWKSVSARVTAPKGATKVRFGTVLSAAGSVDVDNVVLVAGKATTPATAPGGKTPVTAASTKGLVSFSFDDGWTNQLTNAAPIMQKAGINGTFYLISGAVGTGSYMTVAQAKQLQGYGNEIGSHTVSHKNLTTLSAAELTTELANSKTALEANFGPITSLAYPYGAANAQVQAEAAKYYTNARSTNGGNNVKGKYNKYSLTIGYVLNTTPISSVQAWVNEAKANNSWLILCYHRVADDGASDPYTATVASFQEQVNTVKASGVPVVTVRDGFKLTS